MLFVGAAILYLDQAARVRVRASKLEAPTQTRRDAEVRDADDADGKRGADLCRPIQDAPEGGQPGRRGAWREGVAPVVGTRHVYDFLNIVEAPDAETVAKLSIALGARGSAKLQTFELIEIESLLDQLSS